MFLSLQTYVTVILISLIAVQYAFALFCLLKLAFFDISKKEYVIWNLLILLVFFIGGAAFLVYYFKHPDKHIAKQEASGSVTQTAEEKPTEEEVAVGAEGQADAEDAPQEKAGDKADEASGSDATENADSATEPQNGGESNK